MQWYILNPRKSCNISSPWRKIPVSFRIKSKLPGVVHGALSDWPLHIPPNLTSGLFPLGSYQSRSPNSLEISEYIHQFCTCVFMHTAPLCLQCIPWTLSKQLLFFLQNSLQRSFLQQALPDLMSGWDDLLFPDGTQIPCLSSYLPPCHAIIGLLSLEC